MNCTAQKMRAAMDNGIKGVMADLVQLAEKAADEGASNLTCTLFVPTHESEYGEMCHALEMDGAEWQCIDLPHGVETKHIAKCIADFARAQGYIMDIGRSSNGVPSSSRLTTVTLRW